MTFNINIVRSFLFHTYTTYAETFKFYTSVVWVKYELKCKLIKQELCKFLIILRCIISSVHLSSVAQSCPTLCNSMGCSTPGLTVHHQLPEFTQTHTTESVMPSNHLMFFVPFFSDFNFQALGSFQMSQFFASGGQSIGASASASVLPMNIQDWFPLGWTSWSSVQSKGLSRIFYNTKFKSINSSALSFLYSTTITSTHD